MRNVAREVAELRRDAQLWEVDINTDVKDWIDESRSLSKLFVYSPEILAAVAKPGDMEPINLSDAYVKAANAKARQRVVAAGLRLAKALKSLRMSSAAKP